MRSLHRFWPVTVALVCACSDLGDPYLYRADCNRSTAGLDFGKVPLGSFAEGSVLLQNDGNDDVAGEVTVPDPEFAVVSGGGPFVIPPGGKLSVRFRYAPKDTGFHREDIDFGDGCGPFSLVGIGAPPPEGPQCVIDPPDVSFSPIKINETAERAIEIRNVGLIDFNVDVRLIDAGPFEIISGGGFAGLDPGDTLRVAVRFAPSAAGDFDARLLIGAACDTLSVSGTATPPFTVSYATQVQPIFNSRCVSCHPASGGLDLRSGFSYSNLVNVVSPAYGRVRVVPGDPDNSVLYAKIIGDPDFGSRMPPTGSALTATQRQIIHTWILEGANNN
jgi:hypothetical protein